MKTEAVTLDLAHDILGNPWLHKAFWTMVLGAATLLAAKLAARGVSRLLHQDSVVCLIAMVALIIHYNGSLMG